MKRRSRAVLRATPAGRLLRWIFWGAMSARRRRGLRTAFRAPFVPEMFILDEIDSFLMSRSADSRSWERSMVDEFLVRMDRHSLPVVCGTNAVDQIDPTALCSFGF